MEKVEYKDLVVGQVYVSESGDVNYRVYAKWYADVDCQWNASLERMNTDGYRHHVVVREKSAYIPLFKQPKSLAQKFQLFRSARGSGSGKEYWEGLEKIAREHYAEVINQSK